MMRRAPVKSSIAAAILLMLSPATHAGEFDPFSVSLKVSAFPSKGMIPQEAEGVDPCSFPSLGTPLGLMEAVERTLCSNSKTRQAWATAKAQAAELGVSRSAYLPMANATFGVTKQNSNTSYGAPYNIAGDASQNIRVGSFKMSLVLTDFGKTSADVDRAQAALDAANANHDATLQAAFVAAAQAYFDILTAVSTLEAARQAENAAKESYMAAAAKYKAGVGGLADQLQAQTAYSKAKLDTVKADNEVKNAQGTLATAMGLPPNTSVMVIKRDGKLPDTSFVKPVDQLMAEAKQNHPSLIAAQAALNAALATVRVTRAEGRPSVTLGAEINRQNQSNQRPIATGPLADVVTRSKSIGVQLNIPLFEGFGRHYRVMSAQGQAEVKAAELADAEQQVMLDVWKNYQTLNSESENLRATDEFVRNAQQSFSIARGRYKAGVGNMLELLNAQTELANAEQKRIQSVSNWHTARLKVAASIGKLGLWAIQ